ncbi:MAG: tetratricopeptide repeat protein [Bryobacterales bacterium]|nr:tetratricopeptide repeat protein [Bryobacterales bacterium]
MLSFRRLSSSAVLMAAALFAPVVYGQTGAISGKVTGPDGAPLKDALIKIERTDIKGNYKVKTNKKGEYFHAGLPLGTYNVICEVNGQAADRMQGVRTRLGDPTEINFDLKQQADRQAAMQKAAESGQLTQEMSREMSAEQKAALEKQMKERAAAMAKNKALNDAFNGGMAALQAKQYDQAVEQFTKGTEADPKQHVIWANLAEAYFGVGAAKTGADQQAAFTKGIEAWNKAIELKPDDSAYHNNFALALVKAKKFPEAQEELTKAAALDPPKAGTYFYNLGAVLTNQGQLEPAGQAFKKAVEADPNHADAQYQYGVYLVSKAQTTADGKVVPPPGTKEAFQKYLELKPNGPFADSAKGMLQTLEGSVQTEFTNPDAKKAADAKKKATTKKK